MLAWRTAVLACAALVLFATAAAIRLFIVLVETHHRPRPPRPADEASLAVFLGSGGHTAEMMRLVAHLDWQRFPTRTWIISSGDTLSEHKALELERTIASGQFRILRIPRARKVHQSYLTSPWTTLYSLASCVWHIALAPLLFSSSPPSTSASSTAPSSSAGGRQPRRRRTFADVVLLNGPGSCVPITLAAFLLRLLPLASPPPRLIYLESLARTRRLSLSARLVRPFVDRFFVQWDALRDELLVREGEGEGRERAGRRLRARVECRGWLV
ncbi:hypothetical protein JCM8208_005917 [Rhodotorula glutinis]